jgi:hypothetical protein
MNPTPKTLQVFLPEGTPAGIQIAELTTRIVQAISVPRTHLKQFFARPEAQHVGTYFLFGGDDDSSKPLAYIGQTENLKQRLKNHDANKEFWTRAVVLVSRTHSFTQAHIKWLEWNAIAQAIEAKRFNLKNGDSGSEPHVTEAIQADLHEIFETGSLLLQSLGYPIFQPLIATDAPDDKNDTLYLTIRETNAKGRFGDSGFVVFKGSVCSHDVSPHAKESPFARKRAKMVEDGIIKEQNGRLVFDENFNFNSPSGASCILAGRHTNGWLDWKTADGKTLREMKGGED